MTSPQEHKLTLSSVSKSDKKLRDYERKNKVKNRRVLTDDASDREDPSPLQAKGTANALQSGRMDGLPLLQHRPDAMAQHHPSIAKSRLPTFQVTIHLSF